MFCPVRSSRSAAGLPFFRNEKLTPAIVGIIPKRKNKSFSTKANTLGQER